ncbi:MAG: restriction endonuclease subunit S [Bacteroidales bacterium]|nr:restriction endonuclease subunit S [Bacteroidales bacterium]
MKKQRNIPKLRFPEFKGEWKKRKLGELSIINPTTGKLPEKFIYIDLESVINGDLTKEVLIDKNAAPSRAQRVLEKDDILFQMVRPYQKNNLYFDKSGDYVASTGYAQIKTKQNSRFIYQYLHLQKFVDEVIERCTGTSYPAINSKDLAKISIRYPSLPEQKKIASFFTAIDQKISQLKSKKTLLEQYKKGVMQKIFSQEIRFKDDNGQEFPKWEKMTGDALFKTVSNKNHNSDLPILAITQEHGAVPRDMIDYYITVSEQSIEGYKVVEKGDFIISLRSFQGGIEYSEYKGICSPAYIILRATQKIDHRYFKYYFKTEDYITNLNRKLEGIRDGKMISFKYFSEIKINVPSLPEQAKIANFLSAIDVKINHTQKQIEKAEVWKKGLMQQMFV